MGQMKKTLVTVVALAIFAGAVAQAGVIERACLKSDRKAANRNLCGCIQDVADATLNRSDQRMAAKFFKAPEMAQEIRQSDRATHESFWKRYKEFGASAKTYCG
jgi:Ni/Co efflux regulator RcnB